MKYLPYVYDAVKEFYKENYGTEITNAVVDSMSNKEVLGFYLEWEGIIGYTTAIVEIMEAK